MTIWLTAMAGERALLRSAIVEADEQVVAERTRLAGEDEPLIDLALLEREVFLHLDLTLEHPGAAGAADPAPARIGQVQSGFERSIEHFVLRPHRELMGLAVEHHFQPMQRAGPCCDLARRRRALAPR